MRKRPADPPLGARLWVAGPDYRKMASSEVKDMEERQIELEDLEDGEFPAGAVVIDDANLPKLVNSYQKVVVDLYAPWCTPCKAISPIINEMAGELQGKVVFAKLNTDVNRMTMSKFMVCSIPTLLIFKDGKFKERISGSVDKKTIMRKVMSV
jgi:thioredoxin 1